MNTTSERVSLAAFNHEKKKETFVQSVRPSKGFSLSLFRSFGNPLSLVCRCRFFARIQMSLFFYIYFPIKEHEKSSTDPRMSPERTISTYRGIRLGASNSKSAVLATTLPSQKSKAKRCRFVEIKTALSLLQIFALCLSVCVGLRRVGKRLVARLLTNLPLEGLVSGWKNEISPVMNIALLLF